MINLTTNESAIIFEFIDSQHYLTGNGTIEVPKSSLSLITDDSQMATFRKAPSNDIFVSAPYSEFGKSKQELISWFEENGFSDGGIAPEDVEEMIDEAVIPIENDVETISGDVQTLSGNVSTLSGDVQTISGNVQTISGDVSTISGDVQTLSGTVNTLSGDVQTLSGTVNTLSGDVQTLSGDIETISGDVQTLSGEVATKVEQSDFDDLKDEIIDNERVISETFVAVSGAIDDNAAAISGKADASAVTAVKQALSGKANVSDVYTKAETDAAITSAISEIQLSGYVETEVFNQKEEAIAHALTDLHENKADKSEIPDVSNYYTKSEVDSAISGKADTSAITDVSDAVDDLAQVVEDNELVTAQAFVDINNSMISGITIPRGVGRVDVPVTSGVAAMPVATSQTYGVVQVDNTIHSGSTNPVSAAAVYQQLGGLKFVALTQTEYDNLQRKDSGTIYFIK